MVRRTMNFSRWFLISFLLVIQLSMQAIAVEGYGSLDTSFAPVLNGSVKEIRALRDQRLFIWGDFSEVNGVPRAGLAIIHPDGTLDEIFDPGTGANGTIRCAGLVYDRIFLGGEFTSFNGVDASYVVQLEFDGTVSSTFAPEAGPNGAVSSIVESRRPYSSQGFSNFTLIFGGEFTHYDGQQVDYLTMVELSGELVEFPEIGRERDWLARLRSDVPVHLVRGNVAYVWTCRTHLNSDSQEVSTLNYYQMSGVDTIEYTVNGSVSEIEILNISPFNESEDLNIAVSGDFTEVNDVECRGLVILGRPGLFFSPIPLPIFVPEFPLIGSDLRAIYGIKVQARSFDGPRPAVQFLLGGVFPAVPGETAQGLTMWRHEEASGGVQENPDSYPEEGFDVGAGPAGDVLALQKDPFGRFYVGGAFVDYDGVSQAYLARIHGELGSAVPEPPKALEGYVPSAEYFALRWLGGESSESFLVESSMDDGGNWSEVIETTDPFYVIESPVGGDVKYRVRGVNLNGLSLPSEALTLNISNALVSRGGSLVTEFSQALPDELEVEEASLMPDGSLLVLNRGYRLGEIDFGRILKIARDGSEVEEFPIEGLFLGSGTLRDIGVLPDGKVLVAGSFEEIGGHESAGLVRLLADGAVDQTFTMAAPFSGTVSDVEPFTGGRIGIRGSFSEIGGRVVENFAVVESDGSLPTDVVLPDSFRLTSGTLRGGLANQLYLDYSGPFGTQILRGGVIRIDSSGTVDSNFDASNMISNSVDSFSLDQNERILVSRSTSSEEAGRLPIFRYDREGRLDESFVPPSVPSQSTSDVDAVIELPDGRILIAGDFWQLDDLTVPHLAVLLPNGALDRSFSLEGLLKEEPLQFLDIINGSEILVAESGEVFLLSKSNRSDNLTHTKIQIDLKQPYEIWQEMENISDAEVDSDGDGADNILEYALNTSPTNAGEKPSLAFDEGSSRSVSVTNPRSDLVYQFETSTDLIDWDSEGITIVNTPGITRATLQSEDGEQMFMRLKVMLKN